MEQLYPQPSRDKVQASCESQDIDSPDGIAAAQSSGIESAFPGWSEIDGIRRGHPDVIHSTQVQSPLRGAGPQVQSPLPLTPHPFL